VEPIYLFDLSSQHAQWLSVRQAIVARNISNINTPGYKALDVVPFDSAFKVELLSLATSNPAHIAQASLEPEGATLKESKAWDIVHSGNSVSLEQQLMKASDINSRFALNRSIVKTFNEMLAASVKG
jgi:flagellar basal-body rod protein FlgB